MQEWYLETPGGFVPWTGQPVGGVVYPRDITRLWAPEELEEIGLFCPADPDPIPPGHRIASIAVERVEGVVRYVAQTEEVPLDELKAERLSAISARRWAAEVGGTDFGEYRVRTDRETSAILTAAMVKAMLNPAFVIPNWKIAEGAFITLDAATIAGLAEAVSGHVQATFDHEAALAASVLAASSASEIEEIDIEAGWPQ